MDKVRLGLVGLGWWGGMLAEGARKTGTAEVVACFSRSADNRAAFTAAHGGRPVDSLDALLADSEIEGVIIATPHTTHRDMVERVAAAGKHVFIEKPLALSVAEGRRAMQAAEKAGVVLQVGHTRRRQPANRRIKAMIDAGELGTLVQLEANRCSPNGHKPDLPLWRRDPAECPAGGMTALGVHHVDTFNYLVGPAKSLFAFSKKLDSPVPIDETTAVVLEYECGPLGYIGTSFFAPAVTDLTVYGKDAVAWNTEDGKKLSVQRRGELVRTELPVETIDLVAAELAEFAACVRTGEASEIGGAEGLEVVAVLEAVIESARSRRPVDVADFR